MSEILKIDVTYLRKMSNLGEPLYLRYETIRVPADVKILSRKTISDIIKKRKERRLRLIKYFEETNRYNMVDDLSSYVLIAWSPIITTSALEFICGRF